MTKFSPTGRAPSEPVMQNIPIRTPIGAAIKRALYGVNLAKGEDQAALLLIASDGSCRDIVNLTELRTLTAHRKEDREKIARALVLLAQGHGAQFERTDDRSCITLTIGLAGVGAMIDIDAIQGGTASLISWHNIEHPARCFTPRFCKLVGDPIQARPHHKASSIPADWYSLAMMLDAGLLLAARREAFLPG